MRLPVRRWVSVPVVLAMLITALVAIPGAATARPAAAASSTTADDNTPAGDSSGEADALAKAADTNKSVEIPADNTETTTSYANPDGTLTDQVAATPIRTETADGSLVPIDTSLAKDDDRLAPAATDVDSSFSATGAGALATLDTDGSTSLSMGYEGDLGTPSVSSSTADYPVAGTAQTQVSVTASNTGFSAHVVLAGAPTTTSGAGPTYSFPLRLNGLTASLEHGQLVFRDQTGAPVAASAPLEMWDSQVDAAGDASNVAAVDAKLVAGAGGQQVLKLTPSSAFLNDPSTQYPVTIDPDVSAVTFRNDTFVNSDSPDTYYGDRSLVRVGSDNGTRKFRTFERFDIDKYLGKNVVAAKLSMYEYYGYNCAQGAINAYPVLPTTSTVTGMTTWNNQPGAVTPTSPWSTMLTNTGATSCTNTRRSLDVTRMMSGYTTEALSSANSGSSLPEEQQTHFATIEMRAANETSMDQDQRFCSHEASSAPAGDPCLASDVLPTLSLTYTSDLGDADSYSTTDHDLNDRTTLKINNDNGNALVKADDVQIASVGTPLHLSRYYNALSADQNPSMGPKWSLSMGPDVKLVQSPDNANRFDYTDPTGKVYAGFLRKSDDSSSSEYLKFTSPVGGIDSDLVQNGSGTGTFTLTEHSSQKQMTFTRQDTSNRSWVLTSVKDRSGNTTTINYPAGSSQMTSITDASGHTISFTWTNGRVTQITDANATPTRTWKYAYINTRLVTYTDPAGQVTDYAWNSDADPRVSSIMDPANESAARPLVNLTTTAGQVTSLRYAANPAGDTVGFDFAYSSMAALRCKANDKDGTPGYDSSTNVTSTDSSKGPVSYCFRERGASGSQKSHRVVDGNGNKADKSFTADNQPSSFAGNGGDGAASGTTTATYGPGNMQDQLKMVSEPKEDGSGSGSSNTLNYYTSGPKGYDYLAKTVLDSDGYCKYYMYDDNQANPQTGADNGLLTDTYLNTSTNCGTTTGSHYQQAYNPDGTVMWSSTPAATAGVDADRTVYQYWQPGDSGYVSGTKGMVKSVRKPGGTCATGSARTLCTSYTYDGLARTKTMTDGRGMVTAYDYDVFDRTLAVHVNGDVSCGTGSGTCIRYSYDAEGSLTGRAEAAGGTNLEYDRLNRQTRVQTSGGSTINYSYNDDGKMTVLDVVIPGSAGHTWTYDYDAGDQATGVTGGPGGKIYLNHDNDNKDSYVKFPTTSAVTETRDYTKAKRPKSITVTKAGTTTDVLPDWTYSYIKGGNDSSQQQSATVAHASDASINQTVNFNYTGLGLLSTANADTGKDYTYGYSSDFDLVSEKTDTNGANASTINYGFDKAGQLCWQGPTDGADVTSSCAGSTPTGDTTLTQDAAGNSLGTAATPLTYNAFNQVSSIGSQSQEYNDQGNDLRVTTGDVNGVGARLTNTSIGVVARRTSTGTTFYTRAPSGKILAEDGPATGTPDPDTYYYLTNYQGSVVGLLDTAGNLAAFYRYTPYGDATITSGNSTTAGAANPWRYIGGYYDIEGDGYTQLKARYYDNHGHFTQPDPKSQKLSDPLGALPYGYSSGDPVNNSDVSGKISTAEGLILGGAAIAFTGGIGLAGAGAIAGLFELTPALAAVSEGGIFGSIAGFGTADALGIGGIAAGATAATAGTVTAVVQKIF